MSKRYKLIKKYPSVLINVGEDVISKCGIYFPSNGGNGIGKSEVENYPEFWEEIVEKEWEVIDFIMAPHLPDFVDKNRFVPFFGAKSIKRLHDNTIFSIGDKIKMIGHENDKSPESITKIELNKEGVPCLFTNTFHNNGINIMKAIKRNRVLVTEEGIDIYIGDTYWFVDEYIIYKQICLANGGLNPKAVRFSTEKAAKAWVEINKPKYSLQDIKNAIQTQCGKWTITTGDDLALIDLKQFK